MYISYFLLFPFNYTFVHNSFHVLESDNLILRILASYVIRCIAQLLNTYWSHLYRPQTKLREGDVFTPVCDSVHRGISVQGSLSGDLSPGISLEGVSVQDGLCPGGSLSGRPRLGGTHPTGMHSLAAKVS